MTRTYVQLEPGRKPYRHTAIGDPCRDCSNPIQETTPTALKTGRCKACYNAWFCDWVVNRAAQGKLTGTRQKLNGKTLNWRDPVAAADPAQQVFTVDANFGDFMQRVLCRRWRTDVVPPLYRSPLDVKEEIHGSL